MNFRGARPNKRHGKYWRKALKGMELYWRSDFRAELALFAFVAALVAFAAPAFAKTKHAFVVGINRYENLPPHAQLKKAVGDASAMGEALKALGFVVDPPLEGPTRSEFFSRWYPFLNQVREGDTVAFVFSGHGVEFGGANYLLPRDTTPVREGLEGLLRSESLPFDQLLADLRARKPAFSFVVLDACRNNPFRENGRSLVGGRGGLAIVGGKDSFVMYSAGAGQTALDSLGPADNSPTSVFTRILLPLLCPPGKPANLTDVATEVAKTVTALASTVGHEQTPAVYFQLTNGPASLGHCQPDKPPPPHCIRDPNDPGKCTK
ncbi:MAG: caspase family protein [Hyphomicrobiaceae bacterium]|nr:caspase family protein [Hyphomicrobiaceae bacterium]